MCLIVYLPKGVELKFDKVEKAFHNNDDGWGIMAWNEPQKVVQIVKSVRKDYKEFQEKYKPFEGMEKGIHFRTRTHGKVDLKNCHPFKISQAAFLMHNGIIRNVPYSTEKSDSQCFAESIRGVTSKHLLENEEFRKFLENSIGNGNKILICDQGTFYILNKQAGETEEDGTWYSNDSVSYTPRKYGIAGYDDEVRPYSGCSGSERFMRSEAHYKDRHTAFGRVAAQKPLPVVSIAPANYSQVFFSEGYLLELMEDNSKEDDPPKEDSA